VKCNVQPWKSSEFWKHGKSVQMTVMQKMAAVITGTTMVMNYRGRVCVPWQNSQLVL
jgi:hypothetical protein